VHHLFPEGQAGTQFDEWHPCHGAETSASSELKGRNHLPAGPSEQHFPGSTVSGKSRASHCLCCCCSNDDDKHGMRTSVTMMHYLVHENSSELTCGPLVIGYLEPAQEAAS